MNDRLRTVFWFVVITLAFMFGTLMLMGAILNVVRT